MKPGFGHTDPTALGLKAVPPVCPDFQLKAPCRSPEAHGQALDTWRERARSGHAREPTLCKDSRKHPGVRCKRAQHQSS